MDNIICIILLIIVIILFKIIFKINLKKVKEIQQNKDLEKITDKFPDNIDIAKEMLNMLDNNEVKIEEVKNTQTSLYVAINNKILIADMKNNYARLQTIAHECIHSCQDRLLLLFNFIFSNINIMYFLIIVVLTLLKVVNNQILQIAILMLFTLIKFSVRSFLEIDAMTKAKFLAEKYIDSKKLITIEEKELLVQEYEKINKVGIPFVIDNLLTGELVKILVYAVICIFI